MGLSPSQTHCCLNRWHKPSLRSLLWWIPKPWRTKKIFRLLKRFMFICLRSIPRSISVVPNIPGDPSSLVTDWLSWLVQLTEQEPKNQSSYLAFVHPFEFTLGVFFRKTFLRSHNRMTRQVTSFLSCTSGSPQTQFSLVCRHRSPCKDIQIHPSSRNLFF
jgi:hypothetical protein